MQKNSQLTFFTFIKLMCQQFRHCLKDTISVYVSLLLAASYCFTVFNNSVKFVFGHNESKTMECYLKGKVSGKQ